MFHHNHSSFEPIDIQWQRPVLPDRHTTIDPVESPISRRLLRSLQLASGDRLLTVGFHDPQFVELAVHAVGKHGRVTCVVLDRTRFERVRRSTSRLHGAVAVLLELPSAIGCRYDAVAVVVRDGNVPDPGALRRLTELLDADGRLALVAFEAPAGRIASAGTFRANPGRSDRSQRPGAIVMCDRLRPELGRVS